ncbi:hypothetical protein ACQFJF_005197 [Escherichia coli]
MQRNALWGCRGEALTQSRSDSGVYTGFPLQASSAVILHDFALSTFNSSIMFLPSVHR